MVEDDTYDGHELHFVAANGDLQKCASLIANGHDPNSFDEIGNTPLHYAAKEERFEVVSFLLSHGANVNSLDVSMIGQTPLAHVAQTCSLKMAKALLDAGADPTLRIGLSGNAIDRAKNRKRGEGPRVYQLLCQYAGRNR